MGEQKHDSGHNTNTHTAAGISRPDGMGDRGRGISSGQPSQWTIPGDCMEHLLLLASTVVLNNLLHTHTTHPPLPVSTKAPHCPSTYQPCVPAQQVDVCCEVSCPSCPEGDGVGPGLERQQGQLVTGWGQRLADQDDVLLAAAQQDTTVLLLVLHNTRGQDTAHRTHYARWGRCFNI